jgi:hypothetical protein
MSAVMLTHHPFSCMQLTMALIGKLFDPCACDLLILFKHQLPMDAQVVTIYYVISDFFSLIFI